MPDLRLGHGVSILAGLPPDAAFAAGPVRASVLPAKTPRFVEMGRENGESVLVRPGLHVTGPATVSSAVGRVMPVPETLLA